MCASLCTSEEMCNAYHFNKTSGCTLGNPAQLVGVNASSDETTTVHINAALVPGIPSATNKPLRPLSYLLHVMQVGFKFSYSVFLVPIS